MDEQKINNGEENISQSEKAVKPIDKKKMVIRVVCIVLAIVAVSLSCYFIFREKYGITPEIRVTFAGGEWRRIEGSLGSACYIRYDGKEHVPTVTFWDGNKRVDYRKWIYDDGCYDFHFKGTDKNFESVTEKGTYTLLVEAGPIYKNGRTKYVGQIKRFIVVVY